MNDASDDRTQLPRLREVIGRVGLQIDDVTVDRLLAYQALLLQTNQHINLTSITNADEFEIRVLADSLLLLNYIPADTSTLVDIGSGGGIPGMVLAAARPDIRVTLIDATGKKVRFLREAADAIGLPNVIAIQGRAEELGHEAEYREMFDVVTARAVARLATLAELTLPFARRGGRILLPKGSAAHDELAEARHAIDTLGGQPWEVQPAPVEGTNIIVIDKRSTTSGEYPRRTGVPNKTPLLADV